MIYGLKILLIALLIRARLLSSTHRDLSGSRTIKGTGRRAMSIRSFISIVALPSILAVGLSSPVIAASVTFPSFTGVGQLPGGQATYGSVFSITERVSADGQTVIGGSNSSRGDVGFVWTSSSGIQFVPNPPGSGNTAQAVLGVSGDGTIIVGGASGYEPFTWTSANGSVGLPGPTPATAAAVSPDGQLIAGYAGTTAQNLQLEVWSGVSSTNTGINYLVNSPIGISNMGHIVAGTTTINNSTVAYTWTANSGASYLSGPSTATDISANGNVVVGSLETAGVFQPAEWTASTGWTVLANPFGSAYGGSSEGVSADGSVIVGELNSPSGEQAFVWNAASGMQLVDSILTQDGVSSVTSWSLSEATDLSADGTTIVGNGTDPAGNLEGWVATVPVPEPASLGALVIGMTVIQIRRRRGISL